MSNKQITQNVAIQAAGTNSPTTVQDAQGQPPAIVGSDIPEGIAFSAEVVGQFNEFFAGDVGMWVGEDGVLTIKTWNREIKIKDGRVVGKVSCHMSLVTVPQWLRFMEHPDELELVPWSDQEVEAVRNAIRGIRTAMVA